MPITNSVQEILETVIPESLLYPKNIDEILQLPTFLSRLNFSQTITGTSFDALDINVQEAVVLRRITQLVEICRTNPVWKDRINNVVGTDPITSFEAFMSIPVTNKEVFTDLFADKRIGMVVPVERGGFQIANSGGTASGRASEIVYSRQELLDTYKRAGTFIGQHIIEPYMDAKQACWVGTTLADNQLWSSGTMVGGLLQEIPNINYLGIGPMSCNTYQRIMNNPGQKVLMGIVNDIAALVPYANSLTNQQKQELRLVLYGSGLLPQKVKDDLRCAYPNLLILSFFAATQAETIGLQLDENSNILTAVPGLHLIEIVDENGRWVQEGEEGDLVVTRLFANEAPVLRYKLGDRVIRRSNLKTHSLNSMQFEYVGRSDDFITIASTAFYVPHALPIIAQNLKDANIVDLNKIADIYQLHVNQQGNDVHLVIATNNYADYKQICNDSTVQITITEAMLSGLFASKAKFSDYQKSAFIKNNCRFRLSCVPPDSVLIHRTEVGKTPLICRVA
ncbi:phenylacetate--CoA ligase family protein [Commensalibacter oyaizuii]|uniref:CoF synthetase n=1 Tax=Commensalibacter oyaizuii TaxID=3043873 RepID=A0ABT6Q1A9_9PROT|nr:hypothetical protein [Commensalibacter sp. TBRC 16381]MDI2090898.1 hypothetical protein [Commensalibacter sp. TBRC 16381]